MNRNRKLLSSVIVAALLVSAPWAYADTSTVTPEMKKALAKAEQGPDQLRWFVQRTKTIYALDYHDVMARHQAAQIARAKNAVQVADVAKQ